MRSGLYLVLLLLFLTECQGVSNSTITLGMKSSPPLTKTQVLVIIFCGVGGVGLLVFCLLAGGGCTGGSGTTTTLCCCANGDYIV